MKLLISINLSVALCLYLLYTGIEHGKCFTKDTYSHLEKNLLRIKKKMSFCEEIKDTPSFDFKIEKPYNLSCKHTAMYVSLGFQGHQVSTWMKYSYLKTLASINLHLSILVKHPFLNSII